MAEHIDFDLDALRARLSGLRGREYWRSLEELAESPSFQEHLHREFPSGASEFTDPAGRRQFLRLMGASLALAGVTACTKQPPEQIVPYVRAPEQEVYGRPLFFATAMPRLGGAIGLLVESHEGRPTKIEGNPDHPGSLGATDAFAQASILDLYDPDREKAVMQVGDIRPWSAFLGAARAELEVKRGSQGAGLRILTEPVNSPALGAVIQEVLTAFPAAKWHQWTPAGGNGARVGAIGAFGRPVDAIYHFDQAAVVVSLDSDFMSVGPASVRYAHDFSNRRRVSEGRTDIVRLYAIESTPTNTGAVADHRLPVKPSELAPIARALATAVGVAAAGGDQNALPPVARKWVAAIAKDLQAHRGAGLVLAGDHQDPAVHVLAHAMNETLGNAGRTVTYIEPVDVNPADQAASLNELVADMDARKVDLLLVVGGNPVYTVPADLRFRERLDKVAMRMYVGLHNNETAAVCHWVIPETHYLESWGDVRAFDGTVSIIQPLIAPLYDGRSPLEVIAAFTDKPGRTPHDIVRDFWKAKTGLDDPSFATFWRKALHDGVVPDTAAPEATVRVDPGAVAPRQSAPAAGQGGLELVIRPDPTIWDGRFANNGWLQELPKPLTKLTWDNSVILSVATALRLGVGPEDIVDIAYRGRRVEGPVWLLPGQPDDTITIHLGYGRSRAGRLGNVGFNAYQVQTSDSPWWGRGATITKVAGTYRLATTQTHHALEGRGQIRSASLEEFKKNPSFAREAEETPKRTLTLYPEWEYKGQQWGMTIDTSVCIGCAACVVACQSENNIAVVGKDQVLRQREMQWLRVDSYYTGPVENPETYFEPVPCMQCENAPCEVVCPVAATNHSADGLNDMVYNRCVGTRYCSNNCPYKVRRFNFLLYQDWDTESLKLMRNPDVTVRSRGVMEKCTYCVQRIREAEIDAKREGRPVGDGEVQTACQAVCPTRAIVFGDINDPKAKVTALKAQPLNYALLGSLNTRPRTTYLAAVRNPNPELADEQGGGTEHKG